MAYNFTNKTVLITGGTSGIGRETAKEFAKAGANVVITGRREALGAEVVEELKTFGAGKHLYVKADAASEADTEALIGKIAAQYGSLDIAFNNAGIEAGLGPIHEVTEEAIDQLNHINVKGVILSMKHEILQMLNQESGGVIVNMSSIAGLIGFPNAAVYTASKHAVSGLTRAAALEYAKQKIRVNAVAPGPIETDMLSRFAGEIAGGDTANIGGMMPMGHTGSVADIAHAVLYLASDEAKYTSGQVLAIDGAYTAS